MEAIDLILVTLLAGVLNAGSVVLVNSIYMDREDGGACLAHKIMFRVQSGSSHGAGIYCRYVLALR
jgi:hypothetical protein